MNFYHIVKDNDTHPLCWREAYIVSSFGEKIMCESEFDLLVYRDNVCNQCIQEYYMKPKTEFSVGDTVFFMHDFNGEMSGSYRGVIDGKACIVVNGQNWFFNPSEIYKSK